MNTMNAVGEISLDEQLPRGCDAPAARCTTQLQPLPDDYDLRDLIWAYDDLGYRADADADFALLAALPEEAVFRAAFLAQRPPRFDKRYSHQNRRSSKALEDFHHSALAARDLGQFEGLTTFEALHDRIEQIAEGIADIGPLTIYDSATRLFGHLGLPRPALIYLHAGTLEGAVTLGLATADAETISLEQAARVHRAMRLIEPLHAENFLCIFKSKFSQALATMQRMQTDTAFAAARSQRRAIAWQKENAEAIAAYNEEIRTHGLWSDKYRTW